MTVFLVAKIGSSKYQEVPTLFIRQTVCFDIVPWTDNKFRGGGWVRISKKIQRNPLCRGAAPPRHLQGVAIVWCHRWRYCMGVRVSGV